MKTFSEIRIEPLGPNEAEIVSQLIMGTFGMHVAPQYSRQGIEEFAKYAVADKIRERLGQGHQAWIAKVGGAIVGILELRLPNHISMLFVATSHLGKGIGRRLLEHAEAQARSANPHVETLTVNSSPNAIPAYRKLGFRECGDMQEKNGICFQPMTMDLEHDRQYYK